MLAEDIEVFEIISLDPITTPVSVQLVIEDAHRVKDLLLARIANRERVSQFTEEAPVFRAVLLLRHLLRLALKTEHMLDA